MQGENIYCRHVQTICCVAMTGSRVCQEAAARISSSRTWLIYTQDEAIARTSWALMLSSHPMSALEQASLTTSTSYELTCVHWISSIDWSQWSRRRYAHPPPRTTPTPHLPHLSIPQTQHSLRLTWIEMSDAGNAYPLGSLVRHLILSQETSLQ